MAQDSVADPGCFIPDPDPTIFSSRIPHPDSDPNIFFIPDHGSYYMKSGMQTYFLLLLMLSEES
jgi:hypothetical protein